MSQSKKQKPKPSTPAPSRAIDEALPFTALQFVIFALAIVYIIASSGYANSSWETLVIKGDTSRIMFVVIAFLQLMVMLLIFVGIYYLIKFFSRFLRH